MDGPEPGALPHVRDAAAGALMSGYRHEAHGAREGALRARNKRLGLILASIALVFFVGVVVKYTLLR